MDIQEHFPFHETSLDDAIWYLALNFYKESKESYISPDAIIDGSQVSNCSYGAIYYRIHKSQLTLHAYFDDETEGILVFQDTERGKQKAVYNRRLADGKEELLTYSPDPFWKEEIFKEYERRKAEKGLKK